MTAFSAALKALNLTALDATLLIPGRDGRELQKTTIDDWSRGKSRVPATVWARLGDLFEMVEQAADDIIADQGEADGGECLLPLTIDRDQIDLPHPKLVDAAVARAVLVLGARLLVVPGEPVDLDG